MICNWFILHFPAESEKYNTILKITELPGNCIDALILPTWDSMQTEPVTRVN